MKWAFTHGAVQVVMCHIMCPQVVKLVYMDLLFAYFCRVTIRAACQVHEDPVWGLVASQTLCT
eukprot:313876-Karenia_brevis.AAC.1